MALLSVPHTLRLAKPTAVWGRLYVLVGVAIVGAGRLVPPGLSSAVRPSVSSCQRDWTS
jgi:hypothetical protein